MIELGGNTVLPVKYANAEWRNTTMLEIAERPNEPFKILSWSGQSFKFVECGYAPVDSKAAYKLLISGNRLIVGEGSSLVQGSKLSYTPLVDIKAGNTVLANTMLGIKNIHNLPGSSGVGYLHISKAKPTKDALYGINANSAVLLCGTVIFA